MTTSAHGTKRSAPSIVTAVRDDLRQRREARAAHRALERELASFRTPADVSDLMAAVDRSGAPGAEAIRSILAANLSEYRRARRLAA